jgi:hypothetical protein
MAAESRFQVQTGGATTPAIVGRRPGLEVTIIEAGNAKP